MSIELEWMDEVGKFNQASLAMHEQSMKVRDALIDQIGELVERSGDLDLMAGWAARLIVVAEGDGSEC